jgi:hypothetical protein
MSSSSGENVSMLFDSWLLSTILIAGEDYNKKSHKFSFDNKLLFLKI